MISNAISEDELRSRFVRASRDDSYISLHLEVPVFTRSVDLVVQKLSDMSITAIEFKIHDWKKAILQVQSVALCFDYLSICLPKPKTSKGYTTIIEACKSNGVGLFFYDQDKDVFETAVSSVKTESIWYIQKQRIMGYLEAKINGEPITKVT